MRYVISEQPYILGKFPTAATVTITIYKLSDESTPALTSASCNEVGSTGVFSWNTSNITVQPTTRTEYLWVMTDGTSSQYGKLFLGTDKVDIAGLVWDVTASGHTTAGTFGKLVNTIKSIAGWLRSLL